MKQRNIRALTAPGAPYAMIEGDAPGAAFFANAPRSLAAFVGDAAAYGDRDFLVYEDERLSYGDVVARARALAIRFRDEMGLVKGDRVAIAMRNYPEWVIAFLASVSGGLVSVAFNGWWDRPQIERAIRQCDVKLVIADTERAALLADIGIPVLIRRDDRTAGDFSETAEAFAPPDIGPDDPACIIFTSGSEKFPKAVLSSHGAVVHAMLAFELNYFADNGYGCPTQWADDPGLRRAQDDRPGDTLLPIPLFHINGLLLGLIRALRGGKKIVLMRKWDAVKALDLIDREEIQLFPAVPTVSADLVAAARTAGRGLPSLRLIGGGGAARSTAQVEALAGLNPHAVGFSGWGMTETNALGTAIGGADYRARPRAAGRALPGVALRVVDDGGIVLPRGVAGELQVRTRALFECYVGDEEATAAAFADGWFRTGDIAVIDEDGFVSIVDRLKQIIIRGGENISCNDVQDAVGSHPMVREAVAIGVADERLGEEVGIVVAAVPGASLAESALRRFLDDRLSTHQRPRHILIVHGQLPRLAIGKIDRRACARMLEVYLTETRDAG
ncbi:class I adenylate-forming enzyme family protein [Sphingomonas colocasiae]|uniref:Acyl--CoA ligase n=1 Tax=Sphingomonas colocasiae TaxID=1848973 RepID=A0ABS7PQP5_9SPHN|nr:class I adenylate-forming enzyme family protein [Sphingomonas colocasiae]MBY8823566.1 acyl--CoA ligase [Sphingomonas colocasiae]